MRPRTLLALALVLLGTGVCLRLGFWQVSRLAEKRAANAALRQALQAPPVVIEGAPPPLAAVESRRVLLAGRFDERVHILLSGRARGGAPGVHVVTPFLPEGETTAVLVDRGWLHAPDATRARPQDHREPPGRSVLGVARAIGRGQSGMPWRRLTTETDSVTLWSARTLDPDSVRGRLPYAVAPYVVAELPGAGVPAAPARAEPKPLDEAMHWSYATQWFLFGSILLFGSAFVAISRRRRPPPAAPAAPAVPPQ